MNRIEVTKPDDVQYRGIAEELSKPARLVYDQIAKAYNDADVFDILTISRGRRVPYVGNVRRTLALWGLHSKVDYVAKVINSDEDQRLVEGEKRLVIEKRTPKRMIKPKPAHKR